MSVWRKSSGRRFKEEHGQEYGGTDYQSACRERKTPEREQPQSYRQASSRMIRAKETLYVLLGPLGGTPHRSQYDQDLGCEWNGPRATWAGTDPHP
jgi:hypothetical protein